MTEFKWQGNCEEIAVLLRTLIELQAAQNVLLDKEISQVDTVLCVLEHISKQTCETLNEAHMQTELQRALSGSSEALLELCKTSHPEAALMLERMEKARKELLECCPQKEPKPFCVYEPCEDEQPESVESIPFIVQPSAIYGGSYPPCEHCKEGEENDIGGNVVPVGPFRGFITPSKELELMDFHSGAGGDNPDPVVFGKYTPYGDVATLLPDVNETPTNFINARSPEPSGAKSGDVVLSSGNWYLVYSLDGGNTFTQIDPTTIWCDMGGGACTTADGGFCCDQIVQYVPSIDRFIWLLQFNPGTDGKNRLRMAVASPQDIITDIKTAWKIWDWTSDIVGISKDMDYPDMSVGNKFLYISVDDRSGGSGLLVMRLSLSDIQANDTVHGAHIPPSFCKSAWGSHVSQNTGDEVFWAGHIDNSTLQVFSWNENSNVCFSRKVGVKNWPNQTITSLAPDNNDWLTYLNFFPKFAVIGATRRGNEVWFAWTASGGNDGHGGFNFPNPHVQLVKIDVKNGYKLLEQMTIWNNDYAFAYPSLATNDRGEVGITLGWGGKKFYANSAVGILGDFVVWYPELSDVATIRWGDYVTVRQASPETSLFAGFGYATFKDTSKKFGIRFDPFYILFGRNSVVNPIP